MRASHLLKLGALALIGLALGQLFFASAAANSIPATRLDSIGRSVGLADLAPDACAGHLPAHLITGDGVISGTSGDDLILGGPGDDTIDGLGGDDCILGGGGDDSLVGGDGDDVCVGGPGTDIIDPSCER